MGLFNNTVKCKICGFVNDRGTYDCIECGVPFSDNGPHQESVEEVGPTLFGKKKSKQSKKKNWWDL